jgi:hypothetical protein
MVSCKCRFPPIHALFASAQALASCPYRSLSVACAPLEHGRSSMPNARNGRKRTVRTLRQVELVRAQRPKLPQPGQWDCRDPQCYDGCDQQPRGERQPEDVRAKPQRVQLREGRHRGRPRGTRDEGEESVQQRTRLAIGRRERSGQDRRRANADVRQLLAAEHARAQQRASTHHQQGEAWAEWPC